MPILTEEFLEQHVNIGSMTREQARLLGLSVPAERGWKWRVIGKNFSDKTLDQFIEAGTAKFKSRKVNRPLAAKVEREPCQCDALQVSERTALELLAERVDILEWKLERMESKQPQDVPF